MKVFVDTSALYAMLDKDDLNHNAAKQGWLELLDNGHDLVTTNYVLVECCALSQRRLGMQAARAIEESAIPVLRIHWVEERLHAMAMAAFLAAASRKLSLVDCISFVTMRNLGIGTAFAYDGHFLEEGFAAV